MSHQATNSVSNTNKPLTLLYGGTFNPMHLGHIVPLANLVERLHASRLIYIPCHIPPHKALPSVNSSDRLNMVKLGIKDFESSFNCPVLVSNYEIQQDGKSYTASTLKYFRQEYSEDNIAFVMGLDSLLTIESWYQWLEIVKNTTLYVIARPGYSLATHSLPNDVVDLIGDSIHIIEDKPVPISSSDIRAAISDVDIQCYLPPSVKSFIEDRELY